MDLYKYLKHEHYLSLRNEGAVRVGTLRNYQSSEHGTMVADLMEGAKRFTGTYSKLTAEDARKSKALSSMIHFEDGASASNIALIGNVIIESNYYIFSMSSGYSRHDHEKWHKDEGYDSCYRILFPKTFFRRVTRSLDAVSPVKFLGLFEVHYYDEKYGMDYFDPRNELPAFALKDYDGFSEQKEIRAVWAPLSTQQIEPLNLRNRLLASYIELRHSFKE